MFAMFAFDLTFKMQNPFRLSTFPFTLLFMWLVMLADCFYIVFVTCVGKYTAYTLLATRGLQNGGHGLERGQTLGFCPALT